MSFSSILPSSLTQRVDDLNTLILDICPHAAYSSARIPHAIPFSVPSTLLKRPLFSLQRLAAMLPSTNARTRFLAWPSASRIIVYDADSEVAGEAPTVLSRGRVQRVALLNDNGGKSCFLKTKVPTRAIYQYCDTCVAFRHTDSKCKFPSTSGRIQLFSSTDASRYRLIPYVRYADS